MSFEIKQTSGALMVKIQGELDLHMVAKLRPDLDRVLEEQTPSRLIFSMEGVCFMDSSGLGLILGRYKQLAQWGGRLYIAGVQPSVQKILELSGVVGLIPIVASAKEALK